MSPKPKRKTIPSIDDIGLFYTQAEPKSGVDGRIVNGKNNIKREHIIEFASRFPSEYQCDPRWMSFRQCFQNTVRLLSPFTDFDLTIQPKGGRKFHYDFDFDFRKSGSAPGLVPETHTVNIEFKVSSAKTPAIVSLPQIYQRSCFTTAIATAGQIGYPAFYHTHYLPRLWALVPSLAETPIPDLAIYSNKTKSTTPGLPSIQQLKHALPDSAKSEFKTLVNESIASYIDVIQHHIDIHAVSTIIRESQRGKIYLLWSTSSQSFYVDQLPPEELEIRHLSRITKNKLVFTADQMEYHFLLRWKNGKGICNPAWQISVRKKGEVTIADTDSVESDVDDDTTSSDITSM